MFPINQTCHNLMESVNDDPLAYILNEEKEEKDLTNKAKFILKTWANLKKKMWIILKIYVDIKVFNKYYN